jgi:hypothetical protein
MTSKKPKTRLKLNARIVSGPEASDLDLDAMWRLRLDYLDLRLPEQEDWQRFCRFCRKERTVLVLFEDADGVLQGYFTFTFEPIARTGRKALLIHSKYYYVRTAARGHPKITTAAWRLLPGLLRRYGLRRLYVIAFAFPTSFVSLSRTFGGAMTIQDPATPNWEREVLADFSREQAGADWDPEAGVIRYQSVPQGENRPVPTGIQALQARYEGFNPDWQDGVSLPIMMKLDAPTVWSTMKTNLRRMLR